MAKADEFLAEFSTLWWFAEAEGPRSVEVGAGFGGGGCEAGIVDVIVDDEDAEGGADDPYPTIGDQLAEAVAEKELVEDGPPNTPGVAPPGHVAFDAKE
jgi:hypothetical protein